MIIINCPCFFVVFDGVNKTQESAIIQVPANTTLFSNADSTNVGLNTYFAETEQEVINYLTANNITTP